MDLWMKLLNALGIIVISALCISAQSKVVSDFSCYQCNSTTNAECLEQFPPEASLQGSQCDVSGTRFCIKVTGAWGAVVGTYRFCSSRDLGNQCQYFNFADHDRTYRGCVFTCDTQNCNASQGLIGNVLTSLSLAVGLLLWFRC